MKNTKAKVLKIIREQVLRSFLVPSKVKTKKKYQKVSLPSSPTDESKALFCNTPVTGGEMKANGFIFKSRAFDLESEISLIHFAKLGSQTFPDF